MKKEDKDLLLVDLCAKLPYRVKCIVNGLDDCTLMPSDIEEEREIKPYLRPMSSMTEVEKEEYHNLCYEEERECYEFGEWVTRIYFHDTIESIDWLNAHHFDYRGLIEKGLAIEVTEENNPYEN